MKERPILFNGEMVRAILDGRKTQTRRPVKPQPVPFGEDSPFTQATLKEHVGKPWMPVGGVFQENWNRPLGTVGDRLWVRETWALKDSGHEDSPNVVYRADQDSSRMVWRPSIHMPRWASRIDLEITAVRVERVQDITPNDCRAEGIDVPRCSCEVCANGSAICTADAGVYVEAFRDLWQSIYGNRPSLPRNEQSKRYHRVKRWLDGHPATDWDANPWVWVYEFRRVKP